MECPECKAVVSEIGSTYIGVTENKVPVLEVFCHNRHKIHIQLQVIKNMELTKSDKFPPGRGQYHGEDMAQSTICCPICEGLFGLGIGVGPHSLDKATGAVTPSMVCPYGCGWHTYVTLIGG